MSSRPDPKGWHEATSAFLQSQIMPEVPWPDLVNSISYWSQNGCAAKHTRSLSLPIWACLAAGGDMTTAVPLSAYWLLSLLAARILDDLQDGDGAAQPWNMRGAQQALPIASGVLAVANLCLAHLQVAGSVIQAIQYRLCVSWLLASRSQANPPVTLKLETYLENIIGASGVVFAAMAWSGGRLATDEETTLNRLNAVGYNMGLRDAIYSDCRDLREDLSRGLYTLPVIYAVSLTEHPTQAHLAALLGNQCLTPAQVENVCQTLDELEAMKWSYQLAQRFHEQAWAALRELPSRIAVEWWQYVVDS